MTTTSTSNGNSAAPARFRRLTSFAARALVVPVIAGGIVVATAGAAFAAVGPYHTLASPSLNERSGASTSSPLVGSLPDNTSVMISCQTAGGAYSTGGSPATDTIWDQLSNGAYVADYWVSTPAVGTFSPGIPRCGTPPPPNGTVGTTVGNNPFPSGQCTWGADQLVHNLMASDPSVYPAGHNYIKVWGNADQWASSAASYGWTVVNTPAVNSLVVFQPGVQGADQAYGHVALVTAVYSNRTFQIKEMNGPAGPGAYDYRTVADASGESFILVPPFS